MIGTLINCATVLMGSLLGLFIKKGIPERIEDSVQKVLGLATIVISINGLITSMITVEDGIPQSDGTLLLIISLVAGTIFGELIHLDDKINGAGDFLEKKFHMKDLSRGFVTASMLFCIGPLTIVGSLEAGLKGDISLLLSKSIMDGVSSVILTSTLGIGVLFSVGFILIFQGGITLLSSFISPFITDVFLNQFSMVGYAIVICLGLNLLKISKIRVGSILPALLIPIIGNLYTLL